MLNVIMAFTIYHSIFELNQLIYPYADTDEVNEYVQHEASF